eukprot:3123094-Alexandrium_andersonii.AAC.1
MAMRDASVGPRCVLTYFPTHVQDEALHKASTRSLRNRSPRGLTEHVYAESLAFTRDLSL